MPLQSWIHHWEEGAGARLVKIISAILAFVAFAALYNVVTLPNFFSEEAMENAQLARNIAQGKGYTTDSIRPFALFLLQDASPPGQSYKVLAQPTPDLNTPPVYPWLLAGLMKVAPFKFNQTKMFAYQPERVIGVFNQALFFLATALVFVLASRLFDARVAWLAAILFAGSELLWRFAFSGLSTILLILIFLGLVWCLAALEGRDRSTTDGAGWRSLPLAVLAGALTGIGGLTRYAFIWMLAPVLLFVLLGIQAGAFLKIATTMLLVGLAIMAPWVARNVAWSGHCFGAAGYALEQGTDEFPDQTLERSVDPTDGLRRMRVRDMVNKVVANGRDIYLDEFPKLCGTWLSAFFLVGLLIPFRNVGLTKLRWFAVFALAWMALMEAFGRTHLSTDHPQINSENMLVIFAPIVVIYGCALFFALLDRLELPMWDARGSVIVAFSGVMCAPLLFAFLMPKSLPPLTPYSPSFIHGTCAWVNTNENMISDIPSGVAWYGDRSCLWLPLDDDDQFFKLNAEKQIHGLYLTEVTANGPFLSGMKLETNSWGNFMMRAAEHQEVPTGFTLRKGPTGYLPYQLFLSDRSRWLENRAKH